MKDFEKFLPDPGEGGSGSKGPAPPVDEAILEGGRNTTLASLAGTMRRRSFSEPAIEKALLEENRNKCNPPLPDDDVRKIARSIGRYEPEAPVNSLSGSCTGGPTSDWKLFDLAEVYEWPVEPTEWLVTNLIPKGGIGFLSGAPKDGKSLLALDLSIHLVTGSGNKEWLNQFPCKSAKVLYIAREDPLSRVKERAEEMLRGYGINEVPPSRLILLVRERFLLTNPGHIEWLKRQIQEHEIDLLILDVLNRMIPDLDELSAKDMASMVSILEELNRESGVTILLLDHTRKPVGPRAGRENQNANPFDLKGSVAKYGVADYMLCVSRTRDERRLQFYCENKDTDERPRFFIEISPKGSLEPKFRYAGEFNSMVNDRKEVGKKNHQKVLDAVSPTEARSTSEIAKLTGLSVSATRDHLKDLREAEEVQTTGNTRNRKHIKLFNGIPERRSVENAEVTSDQQVNPPEAHAAEIENLPTDGRRRVSSSASHPMGDDSLQHYDKYLYNGGEITWRNRDAIGNSTPPQPEPGSESEECMVPGHQKSKCNHLVPDNPEDTVQVAASDDEDENERFLA